MEAQPGCHSESTETKSSELEYFPTSARNLRRQRMRCRSKTPWKVERLRL
jgi:hypothetical protein